MTPEEKIVVIRAQAAGKPIRHKRKGVIGWFDTPKFKDFNFEMFEYEVKLEPPKPREFWLIRCARVEKGKQHILDSRPIPCAGCTESIHVREVLPNTEDAA